MLKLNNLTMVKNARVNANISFTGLVANSRKGTFTISPVLAGQLGIKEGNSAMLLQASKVDASGVEVPAYYLAKGLTYVPVLDDAGNPVRQEKIMKFVYQPNTGCGTIVRETESKMFAFTNAGMWHTVHGNPGMSARFQVGTVEQIELNTKDLGEAFDKTFVTNIVEVLIDTKKEVKGATRVPGGAKAATPTSARTEEVENEIDTKDGDFEDVDFEDDDFGDDE